MATTIDYTSTTYRIIIPQADLTNISGSLYELDTDILRNDLKTLEAADNGIVFQDTHSHNTEVTIAGVTYARLIEILNATNSSNIDVYEIFFDPDTTYSVRLAGSNNNMFDLQNAILANTVTQVIPTNSAGLQIVTSGSGVTAQDKLDIADQVWNEALTDHATAGSFGEIIARIQGVTGENVKWSGLAFDSNNNMTAATITQYTDKTLTTSVRSWTVTATYNANSELQTYQLAEV